MPEEWRAVPSYPWLEVSSHGGMRWAEGHGPKVGTSLKTYLRNGYRVATVNRTTKNYHHLVCEAFHGEKPFPEAVARHLDDDRTNNHPDNLAWGTKSQNWHDSVKNQKASYGSSRYNTALTEDDVRAIRARLEQQGGKGLRAIGREYGLHHSTVVAIRDRVSWKHV